MSPAWALAQAQIAPGLLFDDSARITAWQMEEVSGSAMRELDDEALGWFGRRLPWGSYGMLARASISSPDLGVALKRWCRHHGLLADDITLRLTQADTTSTLSIEENRDLGSLREFCLVSVLRNALGLGCWMVDSRVPLLAAEFAFAAPPHAEAYGVLFPGGPVRFSAPQTAIHFDARYLSLPLRRDEAALRQMLQHALPLTVLQYRRDRLLVARVRQLLGAPCRATQARHWPRTAPNRWRTCCTYHRARCTASSRRKAPPCRASRTRCARTAPWKFCTAATGPSSRWPRRRVSSTRKASSAPSRDGPGIRRPSTAAWPGRRHDLQPHWQRGEPCGHGRALH